MISLVMPWEKGEWREIKDRNGNEVLEAGSFDAPSCILALAEVCRLFYRLNCSRKRLTVGMTCKLGPYCFGPCRLLKVWCCKRVALNFSYLLHHHYITKSPQLFVPLEVISFYLLYMILLLTLFCGSLISNV